MKDSKAGYKTITKKSSGGAKNVAGSSGISTRQSITYGYKYPVKM
jgi:hypothetical protein